jgi:hypothetical protein
VMDDRDDCDGGPVRPSSRPIYGPETETKGDAICHSLQSPNIIFARPNRQMAALLRKQVTTLNQQHQIEQNERKYRRKVDFFFLCFTLLETNL